MISFISNLSFFAFATVIPKNRIYVTNSRKLFGKSGVFLDDGRFSSPHQKIEYKQNWHDEYLKWICGFANAEGGVLVIGKNDKGQVVGVDKARKLMEDLPNKIRDVLGIMVAVNLQAQDNKELVEIHVDPYPNPISYKGEYHYRSGSTNQMLKGAALDRFLMKKYGRTWDGAPIPHVSIRDLSKDTISVFRKLARQSRRLDESILGEPVAGLVEKLNLTEGNYLKR